MRLAKAQNEQERKKIEEEMQNDPESANILIQMKGGNPKETKQAVKKETKAPKTIIKIDDSANGAGGAGPRSVLDLDSLTFLQGGVLLVVSLCVFLYCFETHSLVIGHLMSNKQCKLPAGSFRKQKKGYEEVYVPGLKSPPFAAGEVCMMIDCDFNC
jgi:pre-mRNA-splicing helicase BRR2